MTVNGDVQPSFSGKLPPSYSHQAWRILFSSLDHGARILAHIGVVVYAGSSVGAFSPCKNGVAWTFTDPKTLRRVANVFALVCGGAVPAGGQTGGGLPNGKRNAKPHR